MNAVSKLLVIVLAVLFWAVSTTPVLASPQSKQLLQDLIAKANKEGSLDVNFLSSSAKAAPRIVQAFKQRFGLDIEVTLNTTASGPRSFSKVRAALKLGGQSPFDTIEGPENSHAELIGGGFAQKIEHWKELLAEINPLVGSGKVKPEQVSPPPFDGYSFMYANRTKSLIYNTKLISKKDVPQSRADIANPEYKGMYAVPPWTTAWQFGVLFYPKKKWLDIVDQIGKNACCVLRYNASLNRMLVGQLALTPSNTYYVWEVKAKDANAPLTYQWFSDYTAMSQVLYVVPRKSQHPAAATLFAMWMTTPEAEAIWQPASFHPNIVFGQSELDKKARKSLKKSGSPVVSWFDNEKTSATLKWYGTKEGRKYRGAIVKNLTQRK